MKLGEHRFGFNISAAVLFLIIMLPNIIWFFVPAPHDILSNASKTEILDIFATVFQVLILATLCAIKNTTAKKLKLSVLIILSAAACLAYCICWAVYYCGIANGGVFVCLCIFPCCAFMLYAIDRKNLIAIIPITVFTVLHFISTAINFL
ncbi:MAG: hypothetical protein K2M47_06430 [Clostridiales bacterium]|nr:hypothetical protein [Clostridiales bacterium]